MVSEVAAPLFSIYFHSRFESRAAGVVERQGFLDGRGYIGCRLEPIRRFDREASREHSLESASRDDTFRSPRSALRRHESRPGCTPSSRKDPTAPSA